MAAHIPAGSQLRIRPGTDGLLSLSGELDMASAAQLRAAAQQKLQTGTRRLILDLTDLSFCDSCGLTVFLWADQAFPDGALLHHPGRQLRKILHTTQLERALTID
jgi:anti-anti-sigma factor